MGQFDAEARNLLEVATRQRDSAAALLGLLVATPSIASRLASLSSDEFLGRPVLEASRVISSGKTSEERFEDLVADALDRANERGARDAEARDLLAALADSLTFAGALLRTVGFSGEGLEQMLGLDATSSSTRKLVGTTDSDRPQSAFEVYLTAEASSLVAVIPVGAVVTSGVVTAEIIAFELRAEGGFVHWRASHPQLLLGSPDLRVVAAGAARYSTAIAWMEGPTNARRGGVAVVPRPDRGRLTFKMEFEHSGLDPVIATISIP